MSTFHIREAREDEIPAAFMLTLPAGGSREASQDRRARFFLKYLEVQGLRVTWKPLIVQGRKIVGSCLGIASPGRTAMVVPCTCPPDSDLLEHLVDALEHLKRAARQSDVQLLQALLPDSERGAAQALERAGFRYLADLRYLARHVSPDAGPTDGPWRLLTYTSESAQLFNDVVQRTYHKSMDCPPLTGLRTIEDIMDSHRHTGLHRPELWFLAEVDRQAVGVILTTLVPLRPALEIVYIGVVPEARGRGYGRELVRLALTQAAAQALDEVVLAVDRANRPALEIYNSLGFIETDRRHAWICHFDAPR